MLVLAAAAQTTPPRPPSPIGTDPGAPKPKLPVTPPAEPHSTAASPPVTGVAAPLTSFLDRSVSPCTNFYQFACGTWMAKNPIPPDQSRWGRFDELAERNRQILRDILEKAAVENASRAPIEQQIGDYYAACMDVAAIDKKGLSPLKPALDRIAALPDKASVADELARMHNTGVSALFEFGSGQDFKNSEQVIAQADQGGLGLPDRDYYLKTDPKSVSCATNTSLTSQRCSSCWGMRRHRRATKRRS